jgi:hypothetical protein
MGVFGGRQALGYIDESRDALSKMSKRLRRVA